MGLATRPGSVAILLVEQYYDFARSLADQYLVMERGEIIKRGATSRGQSQQLLLLLRQERHVQVTAVFQPGLVRFDAQGAASVSARNAENRAGGRLLQSLPESCARTSPPCHASLANVSGQAAARA